MAPLFNIVLLALSLVTPGNNFIIHIDAHPEQLALGLDISHPIEKIKDDVAVFDIPTNGVNCGWFAFSLILLSIWFYLLLERLDGSKEKED